MDKATNAYKSMTDGLKYFGAHSKISPITINGDAFPLLTISGGSLKNLMAGTTTISAAFGFHGDGRFVVIGQEAVFSTDADEYLKSNALRQNILSWLGNGFRKKRIGLTNGRSERLGTDNFSADIKTWGQENGIILENIAGFDLSVFDVVIVGNPWEAFLPGELDSLENFAKDGGGLLILGQGQDWATEKDDVSCERMPVNQLGKRLGFNIENGEAGYRFKICEALPILKDAGPINIVKAEGKTDTELYALLDHDDDAAYALEGNYIILHFTNDLWKKVKFPKRMIDAMDVFYEKKYDFIGRVAHPYGGKLWYITNTETDYFMYMSHDHCGMCIRGAEHLIKYFAGEDGEWNDVFAGWGFGHEVGHAMVNKACGGLFQPECTGESWNNVINMYAHNELGRNAQGRNQGASYPSNYYGEDKKYARLNGTDYDLLPDDVRELDILHATTCVFVKLPMLIVDYYGWDGMARLFTQAAQDTKNGVTLKTDEERLEYMIVNVSKAYNVDFSMLFEHWKFPVSARVKDLLKSLPKEETLMGIYKTTGDFDKYTVHINPALSNN